jgi:hypothetical protein
MAVALGEQKRKKEAMDNLVAEIGSGSEENITASIRVAIEVCTIIDAVIQMNRLLPTFNMAICCYIFLARMGACTYRISRGE